MRGVCNGVGSILCEDSVHAVCHGWPGSGPSPCHVGFLVSAFDGDDLQPIGDEGVHPSNRYLPHSVFLVPSSSPAHCSRAHPVDRAGLHGVHSEHCHCRNQFLEQQRTVCAGALMVPTTARGSCSATCVRRRSTALCRRLQPRAWQAGGAQASFRRSPPFWSPCIELLWMEASKPYSPCWSTAGRRIPQRALVAVRLGTDQLRPREHPIEILGQSDCSACHEDTEQP